MKKGKYQEWLTEEGLLKIEGWARDGLTEKQICANMGIAVRTISEWKNRFPAISAALKRGKEVVDRQVENAMFKSAVGFEYEETKTIIEVMPDGEKRQRVEKTKKLYPPNATAQIFWIKNRKPAEWRDRRETKVSGNLNLANTALEIEDYLDGDSHE